jgi:hypothetical protein
LWARQPLYCEIPPELTDVVWIYLKRFRPRLVRGRQSEVLLIERAFYLGERYREPLASQTPCQSRRGLM